MNVSNSRQSLQLDHPTPSPPQLTAAAMCDDASIELQALQATYEAALTVTSRAPVAVTVALAPRGWPLLSRDRSQGPSVPDGVSAAEHEAQCFVRATLLLECSPGYPMQPPTLRLLRPKGACCFHH